jgi:hypothetical protein
MNRFIAITFLVLLGTNVAQYYSEDAPFLGAVILGGFTYFVLISFRQFNSALLMPDFLLILFLGFVLPILLMTISDRSFDRGAYTSQIGTAMTLVTTYVIALRQGQTRVLEISAFMIVAIAASLNIYEVFVENNVWSLSPGRSAGFYVNPNISAEALVGYAYIYILNRSGKLTMADYCLIGFFVVGILTTVSRAGILIAPVVLITAVMYRMQIKNYFKIAAWLAFSAFAIFAVASFVLTNFDLSEDATMRFLSLTEGGGVGDYRQDRGVAAGVAIDLAMTSPFFGVGVRTIFDMIEGPHNMFIAMLTDYGILGLLVYVGIIFRLILIARQTNTQFAIALWLFCGWIVMFGFVSHNLLNNTSTLALFGFSLACVLQIRASRYQRT